MKNRNTLLGLVVAGLVAVGIVWWLTQTPAEKPVAPTASTKPAPAVAAPTSPPKATVAAPTAPVAIPSANPTPAVAAAPDPTSPNADLKTAVNDLIATLQSGDVNAFVQNFIAPSMMDAVKSQMEAQIAQRPNDTVTPEMKAQMEKVMEERMPSLLQQMTQQMAQRPDTMQGFQKMAAALQTAQANPQVNDAGDRATFKLQPNGDKDVPASLVMVRINGRWSLDIASMAMMAQGSRGTP